MKKHKKAILIGAAIAVAATVVVCAVIAYSSAAAAAGAIGAVAAAVEHDSPKIERQPLSTVCDPLIEDQVEASLSDAQALDEAPLEPTIKENAVELASQTVHIALSGLGTVADLMVIQDNIFLAIANRLLCAISGVVSLIYKRFTVISPLIAAITILPSMGSMPLSTIRISPS